MTIRALALPAVVASLACCADHTGAWSVPASSLVASADQPLDLVGHDTCPGDVTCHRTGCSGEVCSDHDVASPCIWRPEFSCYREDFARCTCVDGRCGWASDPELAACLARRRPGVDR